MKPTTDAGRTLFEEHRRYLFAIAYRMLGSAMDAEDMVQETFVRWHKTQPRDVRSERAWLTTVITRLCINHLKSARVQREEYIGPWLPEPLVEKEPDPELGDSLSMAFLVVLEALSPTERAVFLLREVFTYEFAEISRIVGKTAANCRQILARARRCIAGRRPSFDATSEASRRLLEGFVQATMRGDVPALLALLDEQATLVADGGGKARALIRPILGAEWVARTLIGGIRRFAPPNRSFRFERINRLPGLVAIDGSGVSTVLAFGISQNRIHAIYIIRNPDKLRHFRAQQGEHSEADTGTSLVH